MVGDVVGVEEIVVSGRGGHDDSDGIASGASICKQWLVQQASVKFIRRFWDKGRQRETCTRCKRAKQEEDEKKKERKRLVYRVSGLPTGCTGGNGRGARGGVTTDPRGDTKIPKLTNELMEYVLAALETMDSLGSGIQTTVSTQTFRIFFVFFFVPNFWIIIVYRMVYWWRAEFCGRTQKKKPKKNHLAEIRMHRTRQKLCIKCVAFWPLIQFFFHPILVFNIFFGIYNYICITHCTHFTRMHMV